MNEKNDPTLYAPPYKSVMFGEKKLPQPSSMNSQPLPNLDMGKIDATTIFGRRHNEQALGDADLIGVTGVCIVTSSEKNYPGTPVKPANVKSKWECSYRGSFVGGTFVYEDILATICRLAHQYDVETCFQCIRNGAFEKEYIFWAKGSEQPLCEFRNSWKQYITSLEKK